MAISIHRMKLIHRSVTFDFKVISADDEALTLLLPNSLV